MEDKQSRYEQLCAQIDSLIKGERNSVGVLANVSAVLHDCFPENFFWVGFYLVKDGELQLGPFQGPVACFRIKYGRGVCGTAWAEKRTVIVPDVELFPGHIACSSLSRSEIVVPIFDKNQEVVGVIDIDSTRFNTFDDIDRSYLERVALMVEHSL